MIPYLAKSDFALISKFYKLECRCLDSDEDNDLSLTLYNLTLLNTLSLANIPMMMSITIITYLVNKVSPC